MHLYRQGDVLLIQLGLLREESDNKVYCAEKDTRNRLHVYKREERKRYEPMMKSFDRIQEYWNQPGEPGHGVPYLLELHLNTKKHCLKAVAIIPIYEWEEDCEANYFERKFIILSKEHCSFQEVTFTKIKILGEGIHNHELQKEGFLFRLKIGQERDSDRYKRLVYNLIDEKFDKEYLSYSTIDFLYLPEENILMHPEHDWIPLPKGFYEMRRQMEFNLVDLSQRIVLD